MTIEEYYKNLEEENDRLRMENERLNSSLILENKQLNFELAEKIIDKILELSTTEDRGLLWEFVKKFSKRFVELTPSKSMSEEEFNHSFDDDCPPLCI